MRARGPQTPPLAAFLRPALPAAALHGLPGEAAVSLSEATGADPAAILLTFLALLGNAACPQPHARFGGAEHPGRLFVVLVGDAASGRKGTALGAVERLFAEADPDWAENRVLYDPFDLVEMHKIVAEKGDTWHKVVARIMPSLRCLDKQCGNNLSIIRRAGNSTKLLMPKLRCKITGRTFDSSKFTSKIPRPIVIHLLSSMDRLQAIRLFVLSGHIRVNSKKQREEENYTAVKDFNWEEDFVMESPVKIQTHKQ